MKVFAPLASECEVTLQLFFENFLQDRGSAAKEFQQTLMVYFCSPLWCVLAKSNQLSPAWLCEAVQEGPITPDGGLIAASEWVYSSGCSPRTTTSDRLKSWPLLKQHKASFQGPPVSALLSPSCRAVTSWSLGAFAAETVSRFTCSQSRQDRKSNYVSKLVCSGEEERTAAYRSMAHTHTYIHGSSSNLPWRTQISPRKCEKCSYMSGFHEINTNLQMNSDCMECV